MRARPRRGPPVASKYSVACGYASCEAITGGRETTQSSLEEDLYLLLYRPTGFSPCLVGFTSELFGKLASGEALFHTSRTLHLQIDWPCLGDQAPSHRMHCRLATQLAGLDHELRIAPSLE